MTKESSQSVPPPKKKSRSKSAASASGKPGSKVTCAVASDQALEQSGQEESTAGGRAKKAGGRAKAARKTKAEKTAAPEDKDILDAEIVDDGPEEGSDDLSDMDMEALAHDEEQAGDDDAIDVVELQPDDSGAGVRYLAERQPQDDDLPVLADSRLPSVKDAFQAYVQQVSRYPLLKPEEETELARRFRDYGDTTAGKKIVQAHLRLVVKIAMEFQRRWMQNVLDLVQEGNVGLIHALNKFDPDKGIKFSYYSSFWIKAYILKFIMDNFRMVKIGTTQVQRKLFFNLNRERQKLIAQGYNPDAEMLSSRLGVSKNDVLDMEQRLSNSDVSLNTPVGDDSDTASRMDFLPALDAGVEDSIANEEVSGMIRKMLTTLRPTLNEKELYILDHRLFTDSPMTLREIGERYHITRERIRQLEIRLLEKIKKHISGDVQDFSETWINS